MGFDLFGQIPPPGPNDPPEAHERHAAIREGRSEALDDERTVALPGGMLRA